MMIGKKLCAIVVLVVACFAQPAWALEEGEVATLFNQTNFEGWIYSRPNVDLSTNYISRNNVRLYHNKTMDYTLTSPALDCTGADSLSVTVTWVTDAYDDETFIASKTALTIAMLDDAGVATDSVTVLPAVLDRQQDVTATVAVPVGAARPTLRLASWKADVNSNGAVRAVVATAKKAVEKPAVRGDVTGDGVVNASDVAAVVNAIAMGDVNNPAYDVNGDGVVNATDIALIVSIIAQVES